MPGNTTPEVVQVPHSAEQGENVVYLNDEATRSGGAIPANPHANDYEAGEPIPEPPVQLHPQASDAVRQMEDLRKRAAQIQASLPAFGSHGPVPLPSELVPPPIVDDNPFGDFFADGPSAWLVDDEDSEDEVPIDRPRILGTLLAAAAICMLITAWVVWGWGMYQGAGGAEAGGFLLVAGLLWIWYLNLPRAKQHAAMLRWHQRVQRLVERRVAPLRDRTEGSLAMRRERDRYRAMASERERRIAALGEGAYRHFRQGALSTELQPQAQRVMAIERQMLVQDQRIHTMQDERHAPRTDAASDVSEGGHPMA